jgi:hypothetical protein
MTVLQRLKAIGLHIGLAGENLKCGPKHLLTEENRSLILKHKADIIQELRREGPPYPNGRGLVKCSYCNHLQEGRWCRLKKIGMLGVALLHDCKLFESLAGDLKDGHLH